MQMLLIIIIGLLPFSCFVSCSDACIYHPGVPVFHDAMKVIGRCFNERNFHLRVALCVVGVVLL